MIHRGGGGERPRAQRAPPAHRPPPLSFPLPASEPQRPRPWWKRARAAVAARMATAPAPSLPKTIALTLVNKKVFALAMIARLNNSRHSLQCPRPVPLLAEPRVSAPTTGVAVPVYKAAPPRRRAAATTAAAAAVVVFHRSRAAGDGLSEGTLSTAADARAAGARRVAWAPCGRVGTGTGRRSSRMRARRRAGCCLLLVLTSLVLWELS